jgi:hypothetical protein
MSKYIIEIPDDVQYVLLNGKADHKYYTAVHPIAELEELNSDYIDEHFGDLQDTVYQRGLNDAWEAVRKIALMDTETSENVTGYFGLFRIMENLTPMQAIDKLKAYEEQKADELKVGDELEHTVSGYTSKAIFLEKINDDEDWYKCLFWTGCGVAILSYPKRQFKRTGRHFDIDKILEEMGK